MMKVDGERTRGESERESESERERTRENDGYGSHVLKGYKYTLVVMFVDE